LQSVGLKRKEARLRQMGNGRVIRWRTLTTIPRLDEQRVDHAAVTADSTPTSHRHIPQPTPIRNRHTPLPLHTRAHRSPNTWGTYTLITRTIYGRPHPRSHLTPFNQPFFSFRSRTTSTNQSSGHSRIPMIAVHSSFFFLHSGRISAAFWVGTHKTDGDWRWLVDLGFCFGCWFGKKLARMLVPPEESW
jgi:hypothetical protein